MTAIETTITLTDSPNTTTIRTQQDLINEQMLITLKQLSRFVPQGYEYIIKSEIDKLEIAICDKELGV